MDLVIIIKSNENGYNRLLGAWGIVVLRIMARDVYQMNSDSRVRVSRARERLGAITSFA